jgi:hypothetical protein
MRFKGFIGPTYTLSSLDVDCQRCVNLFPEVDELRTQAEGEIASLQGTPGLRKLATIGIGPIRGLWDVSKTGRSFVLSGNALYEVYSNWTSVLRGNVSNTAGAVTMSDNGLQLFVPDGVNGWVLDLTTNVWAQVTAAGFYGGDSSVGQDGYIVLARPGTDQFYISGLNDALAYDALDIQGIGGVPDLIVRATSLHRKIWLLCKKSTQVWWNSGDSFFPFTRIDGASSEYGCIAEASVARFADSLVWLGGGPNAEGLVLMTLGDQPTRISNYAVETAINALGDLSAATGWAYVEAGHPFYCLNLPGAETTWVYDMSTQQWHERAYFSNGAYQRHRADCHMWAFGIHIVGDYQNGNIYALDSNVHTDDGALKVWMRRAPHIVSGMDRMFFSKAQFDMEMGTGLDGLVQGSDPQVFLRYSDDGGHTWSHEKQASSGRLGEYRKRMIFRRLGSSRNRVFELRGSDPVKIRILGADLDIEKGAS